MTLAPADEEASDFLSIALNSTFALSENLVDRRIVKAVFELKFCSMAGYMPDLFGCHMCGNQSPDRFDISAGQLECQACRSNDSKGIRMPVTASVLEAMRYICLCDPRKLFSFRLGTDALEKLANLSECYLCAQLERGFSTLDFYKSLLI